LGDFLFFVLGFGFFVSRVQVDSLSKGVLSVLRLLSLETERVLHSFTFHLFLCLLIKSYFLSNSKNSNKSIKKLPFPLVSSYSSKSPNTIISPLPPTVRSCSTQTHFFSSHSVISTIRSYSKNHQITCYFCKFASKSSASISFI